MCQFTNIVIYPMKSSNFFANFRPDAIRVQFGEYLVGYFRCNEKHDGNKM